MGEEGEEDKKKNKKVTECIFTTVPVGCMYIHVGGTLPNALGKKIENDVSTFLRKAVKGLRESRTLYHLRPFTCFLV